MNERKIINREKLISLSSKRTGLPKWATKMVLDDLPVLLREICLDGDEIRWRGFFTMELTSSSEKNGVINLNGEEEKWIAPSRKKLKFKLSVPYRDIDEES